MADVTLTPHESRTFNDQDLAIFGRDKERDAMEMEQLENFLNDLKEQPAWREEANRACDYYDGNQLDRDTLQAMEDKGLPTVVVNLCKPTIDAVLGMEVKTRTDWIVKAETDAEFEMAKALTVKLKEAEKASKASRACADAYGSQVKCGIGWVEIGRESDPFKYKYRAKHVHRREMWWDWRATSPDLDDARFVVRKRWYDVDHLTTFMPDKAELISQAYNNFPDWESSLNNESFVEELYADWDQSRRTTISEDDWRDSDRERVALFEVWYKKWVNGHVIRMPDGRVIEFDKENAEHVGIVQAGAVELEPATFTKIRLAIWMGPHRLFDIPSPYKHGKFPYVPFFGYREDRTSIPYGMIRAMKDPQDEVNARRAKMLWLLSSNQVIIDEDAPAKGLNDHREIAEEVNRPDAYIVLSKDRQNANAIKIDHGTDLSEQQYRMMLEAKANVQESSGVFGEALGRRGSSAQSGEAIKSLVEQSTSSLGELNDNYRDSRELVGQLLLSMIVEDMSNQENIRVSIKDKSGADTVAMLNEPAMDDFGNRIKNNDISRLQASVTLADVSSTPTYRAQVLNELLRLTQTLPPNVQGVLIESILDASDLPNKNEMVEKVRAMNGGGSAQDMTPEQQQAAALQQQKQQEMEQRLIDLELAQKEADIEKTQSEANLKEAQAEKLGFDAADKIHSHTKRAHESMGMNAQQQQ